MRLPKLMAMTALAATAPAKAQVCPFENFMPQFAEFAAATSDLAPPARARAFVDRFAASHADFYIPQLFGPPEKLLQLAERLFDPKKTPQSPGARPVTLEDVLAMGRTITADYGRFEATFREAFPDYTCDTPLSFGVSLYLFDGSQSSTDPSGNGRMRFGVDKIAQLHPPRELPAFFHHELFHIYHLQQTRTALLRAAQENGWKAAPTWWTLWLEGLATYVSSRLNPQLTAPEIFWTPRDLEQRMQAKLPEAARMLLTDLDDMDAKDAYSRWFTGSSNPPGLPERSGYYLGYLMAKQLDRGDLAALARMAPLQVEREARAFLASLARTETSEKTSK